MNILYELETIDAFAEENLVIFREESVSKRRVYFFQLALAELLYDPEQDQHYIMCLDLTTNEKARMWPMRDLTEWKRIKGAS